MPRNPFLDAFKGYETDRAGTGQIRYEIGGVVINAGAIELTLDLLICSLDPNQPEWDKLRRKPFIHRKQAAVQLVEKAPIPSELRGKLLSTLEHAEAAMKLRNNIAHGPVSLVTDEKSSKVKGIAIIEVRGGSVDRKPTADVDGLARAVNILHKVASDFGDAYEELASALKSA